MRDFSAEVTAVILTRDEEANIGRTLTQLAWAREVIVVDTYSTDATVAVARAFPNVRVLQHSLDDLASQWTYAVAQVRTPWVLTLDADYYVPDSLVREIAGLEPPAGVAGYEASFVYAIDGRPLRATLYTPRAVLLRRNRASFYMDGHTQRVSVDGPVVPLQAHIVHDDRKPFGRFVERQRRYMRDEAAKIRRGDHLNLAGRVRKLRVVAPFAVLFQTLVMKGLILDGRAGIRYAWERFVAEAILSRELFRRPR
jgi:glycosyltransferase involved in cell wall biosynthesis